MVRTKSADLKGRPVDCPICFDTITAKNSCSAECGHAFCNDCWASMCFSSDLAVSHVVTHAEHLELKITEGESVGILCMSHKCRCQVSGNICHPTFTLFVIAQFRSEDVVRSCTRPDIYRRYVGFLAKAFVDGNVSRATTRH
jgi:hypothetical protein